jgi:para-nitrobenzyl esterase
MQIRHLVGATLGLLACASLAAAAQVGVTKVTGGEIQGVPQGELVVYKGVPFAAPPLDDLRWRDPQPVRSWSGVRDATAFASPCMQPMSFLVPPGPRPSEDCLYLNIWAPARKPAKPLPVMVWIHGGAFTAGAPTASFFDGTHFAKRGVILVSIAYRLGPLGFLAHPELSKEAGHGSGNYGLKDQIAALRWVQANIASFGGGKSLVTIFGQSAGAGSVSMLAGSRPAGGLFARVIAESGAAFAPPTGAMDMVAELKGAEQQGKAALEELGASTLAQGRTLPAERIITLKTAFRPVRDGYVLPDDHYALYEAHGQNDTPVLLGFNSSEGGSRGPAITPMAFEAQLRMNYGSAAAALLAVYPHASEAEASRSSREIFRDSAFGWNAWTWARLQAKYGRNPVFAYYFDQVAPTNSPFYSPDGTVHTGEIPYVFGTLDPPTSYTVEDQSLSDQVQSYWVNFARAGNPNAGDLVPWPVFAEKDPQVMYFKGKGQPAPLPHMPQILAFDTYYQSLRGARPQ